MTISEQKSDLRRLMAKKRSALTQKERDKKAKTVASFTPESLPELKSLSIISAFLSLGSEISPLPLISALRMRGFVTALPRVARRDAPLIFHDWAPGNEVRLGSLKAPEPLESAPVVIPQLLITPLLAFDRFGNRLGWGGGYYDRTLQYYEESNHSCFYLGLAFAMQEVERVPIEGCDRPLDAILTEDGLIMANQTTTKK